MLDYKKIVATIKGLRWRGLSVQELEVLVILAGYAAREFAESLRVALELYPKSHEFQEMAAGELGTNNLQFDDYSRSGDHADFLWYFIAKYGLTNKYPEAEMAGEVYLAEVRALPREVRAMSIVSRESELPGIFQRILEAKDWSSPILVAFRYYLEEHIRIDSMEGGHAELLSGFVVTEEVAPFYKARLDLYRCISTLFL